MQHSMRWLALAAWYVPAALAAAPAYVATPLGALGGVSTYVTGIDAGGRVVGFADTDAAGAVHRHAFMHSGGVLADLTTLSGGTQSFAYAINDAGQVAGSSNAAGTASLHAVVFGGGAIVDLNAVLGAQNSSAYAINARGDVAGGFGVVAGFAHTPSQDSTSLATRADMIAQGWVPEGYGPDAVGMCAPL